MASRELEIGIASLQFSRRLALALLDGIPEGQWFHVPVSEGNHATWIAGHLAWEDDDCLKSLVEDRGSKLPQKWHDRFAQGSKPISNPDDNPSIAEIRTALATYREELIGFFTASVDRLAAPLPEGLHAFARDLGALMPGLACHEMIHVGQLTVVRKSLKLAPVFG
ncbi:MAG: DinB family protein [Planctomycetota bacterium]|jgi:hypothetical protein